MTGQANLPAERKAALTTGAPVAALVPQTLEEAYRLSQALAASGMAPRGIDKPEQILVAIMAGAELGLAPFQSLQSFAVINGKPNIWGDGMLAVVRARGVKVKEWFDSDDEPTKAFCHVTRPDTGEEVERTFSLADAKKANLIGKTGPWQTNQKRMLQMRARAFALRDGCADMLRGIQIREEVEDYAHVRDLTPKPSGLAARLTGPSGEGFSSVHGEAGAPVEFAEQAEEIADAELQAPDGDDGSATEATSPDDGFPGDRQSDPFDAPDWAADLNRNLDDEATFGTLAKLNAFTDDPANIAKFEALQAVSPGLAKSLGAAITGRRKALADKEGGAE